MKEILLIIALLLAILFDIIRVMQYIQIRKNIDKTAKDAFFGKIDRLFSDWVRDTKLNKFADYLREHWDDEND